MEEYIHKVVRTVNISYLIRVIHFAQNLKAPKLSNQLVSFNQCKHMPLTTCTRTMILRVYRPFPCGVPSSSSSSTTTITILKSSDRLSFGGYTPATWAGDCVYHKMQTYLLVHLAIPTSATAAMFQTEGNPLEQCHLRKPSLRADFRSCSSAPTRLWDHRFAILLGKQKVPLPEQNIHIAVRLLILKCLRWDLSTESALTRTEHRHTSTKPIPFLIRPLVVPTNATTERLLVAVPNSLAVKSNEGDAAGKTL